MKIALIGATGNIGSKILNEALSRGHEVTAIARNTDRLEQREGVSPQQCDLAQVDKLAKIIAGKDAVIVSVRYDKNDVLQVFDACREAGVKRVLLVGGAASLEISPGVRLLDTPGFPEEIKIEAAPAAEALDRIRKISDLDWTFQSPSMIIEPGKRTGNFRIGGDELLKDKDGNSKISQEDFAVAMIDELENPKHIKKRFTVGY
jgi:uncharacterized protein